MKYGSRARESTRVASREDEGRTLERLADLGRLTSNGRSNAIAFGCCSDVTTRDVGGGVFELSSVAVTGRQWVERTTIAHGLDHVSNAFHDWQNVKEVSWENPADWTLLTILTDEVESQASFPQCFPHLNGLLTVCEPSRYVRLLYRYHRLWKTG